MDLSGNELTVPYRTFSRFRASLAQIQKHTEALERLAPLLKSQATTHRRRKKLVGQAQHFTQSTCASLTRSLEVLQAFEDDNIPNAQLHINTAYQCAVEHESDSGGVREDSAAHPHIGAATTLSTSNLPSESSGVDVALAEHPALDAPLDSDVADHVGGTSAPKSPSADQETSSDYSSDEEWI